MAETYTQKDMTQAAERLTVEAQLCQVLASNETLYYTSGSTGVAAVLEIRKEVDGEWKYRRANWIPRFSPKDSKRTQYRMMYSAAEALRGAFNIIEGLKVDLNYLQSETGGTPL